MSIIVYSKPSCVQCVATYRALDNKGLAYKVVDISKDAAALAHLQGLGYKQVPVVMAGTNHWTGFRPDMINQLA